jgi:CubicO group peptidase (beta-lactamase class C family)
MRRLALASFLALACTHVRPPAEPFVARAEAFRNDLRIPSLSIAVARDGEILLARGLGDATPDTLYPIGSVTKTFTATLMLQLAEAGRLDLDKAVAGFVDWQVDPAIRIRHVLSHTSGGVPGTRFSYSSRFNWLDNVVEAATKESFRKLMTSQVLVPAGLTRTFPGEEGDAYPATLQGLAEPYRIDEKGNAVRSKYPPMPLHSSSGLSSTAVDLAKYSIALDEHRLLSPAALERAYTPSGPSFPYGLGWYTQVVHGKRVVWHAGWWPDAYSALIVKVPARRLTLVALANTDGLSSPQRGAANVLLYPLANDFLRTFLIGKETEELRGTRLMSEKNLREAIECCPAAIATLSDDDRLNLFGESADPLALQLARDAGSRLTAAFPDDLTIRFNAALAYGKVRPTFRINGPHADEAVALLEPILASKETLPGWMNAWTSYLVADAIAERDPARARQLAERAQKTGVDTDRLQSRVTDLLQRLR